MKDTDAVAALLAMRNEKLCGIRKILLIGRTDKRQIVAAQRIESAAKSASAASASKHAVPPFSKKPLTASRSEGVVAGIVRVKSAKLEISTGFAVLCAKPTNAATCADSPAIGCATY